jgi:hypothetical protein|tara:strand:- start:84 stop:986 length:903 start_codon:yes stop_codon:yes gene_type:complete
MANKKGHWTEYLLAGGTAGMVARTCIAPVERMKILFQVQKGTTNTNMRHLLSSLINNEGPLSMWKGNSAAVIRVIPYTALQFTAFEHFSVMLASQQQSPSDIDKTLRAIGAGSMAGCVACALTYPLDMVRARMALQNEGLAATRYTGVFNAVTSIARSEGPRALYRGISPTLGGVAPYTGLKFGCYGFLKSFACTLMGVESEKELPAWARAAAGATAGSVALTFVYPFDVVRRRFQTHPGPEPYAESVVAAFRNIWRQEGVARGLYRGLSLNYLKTIPNVAIYMSLYDVIKNLDVMKSLR